MGLSGKWVARRGAGKPEEAFGSAFAIKLFHERVEHSVGDTHGKYKKTLDSNFFECFVFEKSSVDEGEGAGLGIDAKTSRSEIVVGFHLPKKEGFGRGVFWANRIEDAEAQEAFQNVETTKHVCARFWPEEGKGEGIGVFGFLERAFAVREKIADGLEGLARGWCRGLARGFGGGGFGWFHGFFWNWMALLTSLARSALICMWEKFAR